MLPMLLLALAASQVTPAPADQPNQIFIGPAFEAFAKATDTMCPERHARTFTPGDLDWEQESFEESLPKATLRRLTGLNDAQTACADRDGLSCSASHTLDAIQRARLMPRFAGFVCSHAPPTGVTVSH